MPNLNPPGTAASTPVPRAAGLPDPSRVRPFDPTELLSRLWKANLPVMRERVALLETAAQQVQAGHLSDSLRIQASDVAHKLAGSLGMFGFPQGTEIARQLEALLESESAPDPTLLAQLCNDLRLALPL